MILPARMSADVPAFPPISTFMLSAFTKASTRRLSASSLGAIVDFPAPLGPAIMKRLGTLLPFFTQRRVRDRFARVARAPLDRARQGCAVADSPRRAR